MTALALSVQPCWAQVTGDAPGVRPDAIVDLKTDEGIGLVKGQWRYSNVKIIDVDHHSPGPDLASSGPSNRTQDIDVHAGVADFDDSQWERIAPAQFRSGSRSRAIAEPHFVEYGRKFHVQRHRFGSRPGNARFLPGLAESVHARPRDHHPESPKRGELIHHRQLEDQPASDDQLRASMGTVPAHDRGEWPLRELRYEWLPAGRAEHGIRERALWIRISGGCRVPW